MTRTSLLANVLLAAVVAAPGALAQASPSSCSASVPTQVPAPSVAPGYEAKVVATNLTKPRGIVFDSAGNLLVVEQRAGIVALSFDDAGGSCLSESSRRVVSNDTSLNHGIFLDPDSRTLYASSAESVHRWSYDPSAARFSGPDQVIVSNMTTDDHTTRTLLLSSRVNGTLIVTRGSTSNLDAAAADIGSGHSQIKSFDLNRLPTDRPYNFNADGKLLGWGLRNDVGIAEEPSSGGLYAVENSADNINRNDVDVHQNNPAEKLNFLGWVEPPMGVQQSTNQGGNFGYPQCFAAWDPSEIPNFGGMTGEQFVIGTVNQTNNDTFCQSQFIPPRLSFLAHMAPLDIKFNSNGNTAWIAFHGSWNRDTPSGFKVGAVEFAGGQPTANRTSRTALVDIVSNRNTDCSQTNSNCFRPVAMAWDRQGRLFFSSDQTGEIYVITRAGASGANAGVDSASPASTPSTTTGGAAPSPTQTNGASTSTGSKVLAFGLSVLSSMFQLL